MVREAVPYLPILFPAPISDRRTRVLGSTSLYRERTWPSRWADSSLKTKQRVCNRADEADAGHLSLRQILAKIIRRAYGTSCNRADLGQPGDTQYPQPHSPKTVVVTAGAQGNEIARRLVKIVDVAQMRDVICAKAAFSTWSASYRRAS
jgi:hypothetical protein